MKPEHANHLIHILNMCNNYMNNKTDFDNFKKEVSQSLKDMEENKPKESNNEFLNWCKKISGDGRF